ncbi:SIR2 family protein [Schaalia sp. JY-X169]|uniref:SIR2 family protein n=1 Tax=Schaalia sp. JY-X169 TaxID=2758572 RepID=UPI0015F5B906|nr:SIR2 family protein [Schaalia sp. JY-X169]
MGDRAVLGGFARGWQEIDSISPNNEDEKARREAALTSLTEELSSITNCESLVVLAGSGTSLGIVDNKGKRLAPSMGDLWTDVYMLQSFGKVEETLTPGPVASKNLEHVLSDAQARLALDPVNTALSEFVSEAEGIIWTKCSFVDRNTDLVSHELFLRKVARRSTRLQRAQVFTTNYDLAFEAAAKNARFNVIDGFGFGGETFDGGSFDLDYVQRRPHEPLTLDPSVFHLLKLHGSVNWNLEDEEVQKVCGSMKPDNPVLIYPSATKYQLSYQQPYLEFMSRFQMALRQPDVGLLVVGFGFNDDHLTAPIKAALRANIGLRAAFVSPGIRTSGASGTFKEIEQLIMKGDRRLTLLEATFDQLVELLPDVPPREEREVHAERFSTPGRRP